MTSRLRACAGVCGAALFAVGLAWPVHAQDVSRDEIAMQNQILELRHDLDALRDQVAQGGSGQPVQAAPVYGGPAGGAAPSGDAMAGLLDRVSQLEDQMRSLQGRIDEAGNKLQQQNADLTKQIGDLAFRVQTLEGGKPVAPGQADAAPSPGAPMPSPPPRSLGSPPGAPSIAASGGHATLQQGYAALARRDYASAEAAARDTLATPKSPHVYDAQFLLAQSLAGQRNYQQAALAFDDTYNKSRKGAHAQDALVGLAGSLSSIGAKPAACATLDKLHGEFPSARADVRASASAIGRRAGCR